MIDDSTCMVCTFFCRDQLFWIFGSVRHKKKAKKTLYQTHQPKKRAEPQQLERGEGGDRRQMTRGRGGFRGGRRGERGGWRGGDRTAAPAEARVQQTEPTQE